MIWHQILMSKQCPLLVRMEYLRITIIIFGVFGKILYTNWYWSNTTYLENDKINPTHFLWYRFTPCSGYEVLRRKDHLWTIKTFFFNFAVVLFLTSFCRKLNALVILLVNRWRCKFYFIAQMFRQNFHSFIFYLT